MRSTSKDLFLNSKKHKKILLSRSEKFERLFAHIGEEDVVLPRWRNVSDAVLYAVIGQMLSLGAATSIIGKLKKRFGSADNIICWAVKNQHRKKAVWGVPQRKRKALACWFKYINNGKANKINLLKEMGLEEYRSEICKLWGFGHWSADMIGMFHCARTDIFPEGDGVVFRVCREIFKKNPQEMKELVKGCETYFALCCWRYVDGIKKESKSS